MERTLSDLGRFTLHSSGADLFSAQIGNYLAGTPRVLVVKDPDRWPFLAASAGKSDVIDAAIMILATACAPYSPQVNAYQRRMWGGYENQWAQLLDRTVTALTALRSKVTIASYTQTDPLDWLASLDRTQGFVAYPQRRSPKLLTDLFEWQPPIDDPAIAAGSPRHRLYLERVASFTDWTLGSLDPVPELAAHLHASTRRLWRDDPVYVYSSAGATHLTTGRGQAFAPVLHERLGPGEPIGNTGTLVPLKEGEFNSLRAAYMNRGIVPGNSMYAYALLIDGKLVGAFAWAYSDSMISGAVRRPAVYLLTDFPVAGTGHPHLARLVLLALRSHESRHILERNMSRRFQTIATAAFTHRSVSMKYRSAGFDLHHRSEPAENGKAKLTYTAPFGDWSLDQAIANWKRKK